MTEDTVRFVDALPELTPANEQWRAVIVRREAIEAEAARLGSLTVRTDGLRESRIVHSRSDSRGLGLAPGIEVRLSVLLPGERTTVRRHNATEVHFCIAGNGVSEIARRKVEFKQYDVWNHPGWTSYVHSNPGPEPQIRLTYSNAPILRMLNVYCGDEPVTDADPLWEEPESSGASRNPFGTFVLREGSAQLMPYEILVSPPAVPSPVLHWPWLEVKEHLDKLTALGSDYRGRRL
jgi:gentisate 1,2-dioxygenase